MVTTETVVTFSLLYTLFGVIILNIKLLKVPLFADGMYTLPRFSVVQCMGH